MLQILEGRPADDLPIAASTRHPKESLRSAKKQSQLYRNLGTQEAKPLSQISPYCLGHKAPTAFSPLVKLSPTLRGTQSGLYIIRVTPPQPPPTRKFSNPEAPFIPTQSVQEAHTSIIYLQNRLIDVFVCLVALIQSSWVQNTFSQVQTSVF